MFSDTSCKAAEMSFKQLYDHIGQFMINPDRRWKFCTRVKRGLVDPNDIGGYGKDQCYFEGTLCTSNCLHLRFNSRIIFVT